MGLLFLNARYMNPQLGMFTQPDWWEVTNPGVGTNSYAYAGGDPVNGKDPGGGSEGPLLVAHHLRDLRQTFPFYERIIPTH